MTINANQTADLEARRPEPAEVWPPSTFIREEMEERGWRVEDLAEQADWTTTLTSEVLAGRRVTSMIAFGLGQAFGTGMEFWLNLERAFRGPDDQVVPRRRRKTYR